MAGTAVVVDTEDKPGVPPDAAPDADLARGATT